MNLCRLAVSEPVMGGRGPGIVAFKADLASPDRARRRRWGSRYRLSPAGNALPELLFGFQELELVEPVGCDLDHLILVIAEDDREDRALRAGDRHVVLELGHVALEDLVALRKGTGVLGLPHRARALDH